MGRCCPEFVWAVLDCPTYFAVYTDGELPMSFLGRMATRIDAPVTAGEQHVVIAWPIGVDGRKRHAGAAVLSGEGRPAGCRPCAHDRATGRIGMIELIGTGLTVADVVAVAREDSDVELTGEARDAMAESAEIVQRLASSAEPAYGVSTGFGSLAMTPIPAERREELQRALIRSHAAGMGEPVEREVVRAMMLLRARSLAMGYSGARPEVAEAILEVLNAGITPVVPEHGSLGASGDLAPLAHCALVLIGEGEVLDADGRRRPAAEVLAGAGIEPLTLRAKEGLALINGTDGILGMLVLAARRPAFAAARRRPDGRHVGGGAARDRSRIRRGPDRPAPTTRAGCERRKPSPTAGRLADRRQSSRE